MMLSNVVLNAKIGAAKMIVGVQKQIAIASVNVKDLLSGEGAAGKGGSLAEVNSQVNNYGKGGFTIVQNLVVYVVAIALLIGAGALAFYAGNANKRDEAKTAFGWRLLAGILAFAGISIMVFAQKIGSALLG